MTAISLNCWSESDQKAIREQLVRILNSGPFHQSQRRQRFLEYLVNEALAGRGERLKAYNVALEVFDRPASFDPVVDPLVRIEAARLRDRLREYYEADGRSDPIHIELPKGSYTPHVEFRQSPTPERGPDRQGPVIAVLPFVNLSGDASQEYFSDGLTEDIMTELARVRDLRVLARNTTFQYKGKAVDVSKLGRELGVRYVLEGGVRRSGDDLRVTAQLIDAETGAHIWADKFDRKMADVFLVQDEIVGRIVAKIASGFGAIENTEAKSAARKSPEQIQAYDLVLRAHDVRRWDYSRANFRSAKESLRQAIALDPLNARARRELAWLAALDLLYRFDETPVPPHEILEQATKAVQLDPSVARARMVLAGAYFFNKQPDRFEHEAQQAIALAPYDAESLAELGYMTAISGDWPRGVVMAEKANALNADAASGWYHATLYSNYYLTGDFERALELIRQDADQQSLYHYIDYLPILGALGRKEEARENWQKILAEDPSWTAESFVKWYKTWNMRDEDIAKLMEGIYKTGVLGAEAKPGM